MFNGPSGITLDEGILAPLCRARKHAWLADLVPHSCANDKQKAALDRCYIPRMVEWNLPVPCVPPVPSRLATSARQDKIAAELLESRAQVLVLLGDEPIRRFSSRWHQRCRHLADFGTDTDTYGRLTEVNVAGARVALLPLAHPRQVAKLGRSSTHWYELHQHWITCHAGNLLS
jgi:uracil-DNA glycosylase